MIFSTIAVSTNTIDEIQINKANIKSNNQIQLEPIVQTELGPVMFSQPPPEENESWAFYASVVNLGFLCMDDFWDLPDEICDVHWWGLSLIWDNDWYACNPQGLMFEIIIYDQSQNPACSYTNLTPTAIPTGKFFLGFQMYKWEVDLVPCCGMTNGWISIQSIYSPNSCSFLWANSLTGNLNAEQNGGALSDNLAFELTRQDYVPPSPPEIDGPARVDVNTLQTWTFHSSDANPLNVRYHIG